MPMRDLARWDSASNTESLEPSRTSDFCGRSLGGGRGRGDLRTAGGVYQDTLEVAAHPLRDALPREQPEGSFAAPPSHLDEGRALCERGEETVAQRRHIAIGSEPARLSLRNDFWDGAAIRADARQPMEHRLHEHDTERVEAGRKAEQVGAAIKRRQLLRPVRRLFADRADDVHPRLAHWRPTAHDAEPCLGDGLPQAAKRLQ